MDKKQILPYLGGLLGAFILALGFELIFTFLLPFAVDLGKTFLIVYWTAWIVFILNMPKE